MSPGRDVQCADAQRLCDCLWESFKLKYPHLRDRVGPLSVHIAIYQHLVSHYSNIASDGQRLQKVLIASFNVWYPDIERARRIDWIDLNLEVVDFIQAETGDYGYASCADPQREYIINEGTLNHQLFHSLPTQRCAFERTNLNQEIVRQIREQLTKYLVVDTNVLGEKELFELLARDVACLLIGAGQSSLEAYLYLFQTAVLEGKMTKQACVEFAIKLRSATENVISSGMSPKVMDAFWATGLGCSAQLVNDYNQLVSLLDKTIWTISFKVLAKGIELSIWRYPHYEHQTKVILSGQGDYHVECKGQILRFYEPWAVLCHILPP